MHGADRITVYGQNRTNLKSFALYTDDGLNILLLLYNNPTPRASTFRPSPPAPALRAPHSFGVGVRAPAIFKTRNRDLDKLEHLFYVCCSRFLSRKVHPPPVISFFRTLTTEYSTARSCPGIVVPPSFRGTTIPAAYASRCAHRKGNCSSIVSRRLSCKKGATLEKFNIIRHPLQR